MTQFGCRARHLGVTSLMGIMLAWGNRAGAEELASRGFGLRPRSSAAAYVACGALQLVPSPLLVAGEGVAGGVRWQVTPFLYSFGVAARPCRYFVVPPVARHTGAIELFVSPEWTGGAPPGDSGWLGRVGLRLYLPLIGWGESLALAGGVSYYYENERHGAAAELGLHTLSSLIGVSVTVSPWLERRPLLFALVLRFF